jgi:hypothetical protein
VKRGVTRRCDHAVSGKRDKSRLLSKNPTKWDRPGIVSEIPVYQSPSTSMALSCRCGCLGLFVGTTGFLQHLIQMLDALL